MADTQSPSAQDAELLAKIVDHYVVRLRKGNSPPIDAYVRKYPHLEERIRRMLAASAMMEQARPGSASGAAVVAQDPHSADTVSLSQLPEHPTAAKEEQSPTVYTAESGETAWRVFGDYVILGEIARGGMGVVYRAQQRSLDRIVALKMILSGQLAGPEAVQRFYTEARAAAHLKHPGIVAIYEVGQQAGQHFFSMEYIEGEGLGEHVPMQPAEASRCVRQIAEAIQYAHSQGVLHRDLKPSNVLIDDVGNTHVTDFGLAKRVEGDSGLTATGQILGTPSYMPPEQASADVEKMGPASDVYALGAILYELLTGRPPFQAASPIETVMQVLADEPVPPRMLNPAIPFDLETICLKCLEKDPSCRYSSAQELADELGCFMEGKPIQARPIGRMQRGLRWCRRQPVLAGLSAAVALSLLLGVVISGLLYVDAATERDRANRHAESFRVERDRANSNAESIRMERDRANRNAESFRMERDRANRNAESFRVERDRASAEKERADQQRDAAERNAYFRTVNLANYELQHGNVRHSQQLLESCPPSLIGWEWSFLKRNCGLHTLEISDEDTHGGAATSLAFHPEDSLIALAKQGGKVRVLDILTGTSVVEYNNHAEDDLPNSDERAVVFSPDGALIASANESAIVRIWESTTGEDVLELRGHQDSVTAIAFSPDGTRLATGSEDRTVRIWDAHSGDELLKFAEHKLEIDALAYSPRGDQIASVSGKINPTIFLWRPENGSLLDSLAGHSEMVSSLVFNPDGTQLASGSWDKSVKLWELTRGEELRAFSGHSGWVYDLAYSSNGTVLASVGSESGLHLWSGYSGEELLRLNTDSTLYSVAFSHDKKWLAAGDSNGDVWVWRSAVIDEATIETRHGRTFSYALSRDRNRLASAGIRDGIKIWDIASGQLIKQIDDERRPYRIIALGFSTNGELIAGRDDKGDVRIWNISNGREVDRDGETMFFSAEDHVLSPSQDDRGFRFDDAFSQKTIATLPALDLPQVLRFAMSQDGSLAATCHRDRTESKNDRGTTTVRHGPTHFVLWDMKSHVPIARWSPQDMHRLVRHGMISAITFSPKNDWLAIAGVNQIVLLDCENWSTPRLKISIPNFAHALVSSLDGDRLAVTNGREVKLYDTATGHEALSIDAGSEALSFLAYAGHGNAIVSADIYGTVRFWRAETLHFKR